MQGAVAFEFPLLTKLDAADIFRLWLGLSELTKVTASASEKLLAPASAGVVKGGQHRTDLQQVVRSGLRGGGMPATRRLRQLEHEHGFQRTRIIAGRACTAYLHRASKVFYRLRRLYAPR